MKHESLSIAKHSTLIRSYNGELLTFKHCLMFSSSQPPPSPHHQKYITHKSKYIINVLCWGNALKRPSEIFLLLFVIQQLHCQTFWFKWCWRFSGHFPTFCFFPIKTSSLSVSLSWVTATHQKSPNSMWLSPNSRISTLNRDHPTQHACNFTCTVFF